MTSLNELTGTYVLDTSHTEIGFAARHAMVTKVRGAFRDFEGTATTGANLEGARIDLTIQAGSVDTKSADRDGHLRSGDFFDVETYPTIRFTSTSIEALDAETLRVAGDLTIKDVTKPVVVDFDYDGAALDPFGNTRVGLSGKVDVNRKDFGLVWNAALETGGVLVSENVTLTFEVSAIKQADADAPAAPVADEPVAAEPVADEPVAEPTLVVDAPAASEAPQATGIVGWFKNLFASSSR